MLHLTPWIAAFAALLLLPVMDAAAVQTSHSVYSQRPHDDRAVYLSPDAFPVKGDGVADDTDAIQQAVDKVASTTRQGIVFIPPGRYRVSHTIDVWPGIRLIGYGAQRPVFVLGAKTPGYQQGDGKYMFWFTGGRDRDGGVRDANPGTFYSALSNVDFEVGDGNPTAVCVRSFWAQHCFIAHVDFHIGSGKAGIQQIGNEGEDLRFFGGDYGIVTTKPSPSWPYALLDSSFDGQRKASIATQEAGLTLVHCRFSNTPTAIAIDPDRAEELYATRCTFENISGPAIVVSDFKSARTELNLLSCIASNVPHLAAFRENGSVIEGLSAQYTIQRFTHGLQMDDLGADPQVSSTTQLVPGASANIGEASQAPSLPPMEHWVNARALGAKGDGANDDTKALQDAIEKHESIYLPSGLYRVSDTLKLGLHTAIIGFNPITTRIMLADATPGFGGERPSPPKPLIETPNGGTCLLNGIAVDTGGDNPYACGVKWQSGGYINDVKFYGDHGSAPYVMPGSTATVGQGGWNAIYNDTHTGDPDPRRKWDSQYPSLWVQGGGGVFKDIWTASSFAQAGFMVSDSAGPGEVYAMSSEHHTRNEVIFRRSSGWSVNALQMEEERGEGPHTLPVSIEDCQDLVFANTYIYRVGSTYSPYPYGVSLRRSSSIDLYNVHCYGPSKFTVDDTVSDETSGARVRSREVARLHVSGDNGTKPAALTRGLKRIACGFNNVDALVTDGQGSLFFVDTRWNAIYRFTEKGGIRLLQDAPTGPCAVVPDASGNLLVVTNSGAVYSLKLVGPENEFALVEAVKNQSGGNAVPYVAGTYWRDAHDFLEFTQKSPSWRFYSPDGSVFVAADDDYHEAGPWSAYWSSAGLIRTYQLAKAQAGQTVYIADEFGQKTYAFTAVEGGRLTNPRVFAEEGEAGVAVDGDGRVYVCAGAIFVYAPNGHFIRKIETPERPTSLAFGGTGGRTLYIGARGSLYSLRL